jgi:hypothetical protein
MMLILAASWCPSRSLAERPAGARPAAADVLTAETAARRLNQRGLTLVDGRWRCLDDIRLRRQIESLEPLQKQLRQTRRTLDQKIEENEVAGKALIEMEKAVVAHQQALAAGVDAATRRRLTSELARMTAEVNTARGRYLPPEQFAADPAIRAPLVGWINARNALLVIALGYASTVEQVKQQYEALQRDAEITSALAALDRPNELGGGRNGILTPQQIEEITRATVNADAPLYRVSGQWRTSIILGDTTPTACTLMDQGPPLMLPESVARAAGIVVASDSARRSHVAADGRTLQVRVVMLPRIRLGGQVISQIETWLLPPEADDLGVLLSRQYLGGHHIELQPAKLRLAIH